MTIGLDTQSHLGAKICVIGVGGAGGNAVNNMVKRGIEKVTFYAANTDKQALDGTLASEKILLGGNYTKGLGAGAKPEVGKKAAEESADTIKRALEGYDLIFITCGMGGGTGTGGSPIIAKIAKETGALVVGIVSKCFSREGSNKVRLAEEGIAALKEHLDAIIVVPNDKILEVCKDIRPREAYSKANDILYNAVRSIVDMIVTNADVNVDFADIRTTLADVGDVIIGIGTSRGVNAPREAVYNALNSPFFDGLEIQKIENANRLLLYIHAGGNYLISDIVAAQDALLEAVGDDDVHIIIGECYDDDNEDFSVTIIAPARKVRHSSKSKLIESIDNNANAKENTNEDANNNANVPATRTIKTKKISSSTRENLFAPDANEDLTSENPTAIGMNTNNRMKGVAATSSKKEIIESVEAVKEIYKHHHSATNDRVGRPHGDEELKKYDVPAFLRRGKGESKYNVTATINELDATDILPEGDDKQKIQNFVNNVFDKPINKFVRDVSNKGLNQK
jgi:cell division protein FtsZ